MNTQGAERQGETQEGRRREILLREESPGALYLLAAAVESYRRGLGDELPGNFANEVMAAIRDELSARWQRRLAFGRIEFAGVMRRAEISCSGTRRPAAICRNPFTVAANRGGKRSGNARLPGSRGRSRAAGGADRGPGGGIASGADLSRRKRMFSISRPGARGPSLGAAGEKMKLAVTVDGLSDLGLQILGSSFAETAAEFHRRGPRQRFLAGYLAALAAHFAAEVERRRTTPEAPALELVLPDPPADKVWVLVENFRRQSEAILAIRQRQQQSDEERALADMKAVAAQCASFTQGLADAFDKLAR